MFTPVLKPVSGRAVQRDLPNVEFWANQEVSPLLKQLRDTVNSGLGWLVDVRQFGARADNGLTDNTAAFAAAFAFANSTSSLVYVPYPGVGNEYHFSVDSAALPVLTTSQGIVGDHGSRSIVKFNRDGDGVVLKGIGKIVRDVEIDNLRAAPHTVRSAAIRVKNCAYGNFYNVAAATGSTNCDNFWLEQEYDGSVGDAYLLVHIGCWYNTFNNMQLNYAPGGLQRAYGLSFAVNANALNVLAPNGQPPLAAPGYSGEVSYNTVHAVNIEARERGINLDHANANYFGGGQLLGPLTGIYGRNAQGNTFAALKINGWDTVAGAAFDMAGATCRCNGFVNPTFFSGTAQPWPINPAGATIDDTLGLLPIWLGSADGISPSVYEGLNIPRGGTMGGIELRANNIVVPGNYMRRDGAGAALTLGNGDNHMYGTLSLHDATGALTGALEYAQQNTTTDATVTDVATASLPDNTAATIEWKCTARRTGGTRGTGAVNDTASFYRTTTAVKNGAGVTAATVIATGTPLADAASPDLVLAAIGVAVATGASGLVRLQATGAAALNLTWTTTVTVIAQT